MDTLNVSIIYSFLNGTPEFFNEYFKIDSNSGLIRQIKQADRTRAKVFTIWLKAEQSNNLNRNATAKLTIEVVPLDKSPPKIIASSTDGYIEENSPLGSIVYESKEKRKGLKFEATDPDIVSSLNEHQFLIALINFSF